MSGNNPGTPNQQAANQAVAATGIDPNAIALAGSGKSRFGLGDLATSPVVTGSLLNSLMGQQTTAEQVMAAFAQADQPNSLDHSLLGAIQQKLLLGGFYTDAKFRPTYGVVNPEDIAAMKAAVERSAQTGSDLGAYLTQRAQDGQYQGIAASIQTAQADVRQIKHANPLDLQATLQAQFQSTLGRKPTAAEMAGFVAAYDHTTTALQQQAYQQVADAKTQTPDLSQYGPILDAAAGSQSPIPGQMAAQEAAATPGSPAQIGLADRASNPVYNVDDLVRAIGGQETGGSSNPYAATNSSGAQGKFQILASNWPQWAQEAGLGQNAPKTPGNQELVARFKLGQYVQKYGIAGAAMAWYGGEGSAQAYVRNPNDPQFNKSESGGPSRSGYVDQVMQRLGQNPSNQGPILFSTPPTIGGKQAAPITVDTTDAPSPSAAADNYARTTNPGLAGAHDITHQFSNFLGLLSGHFGAGSNL